MTYSLPIYLSIFVMPGPFRNSHEGGGYGKSLLLFLSLHSSLAYIVSLILPTFLFLYIFPYQRWPSSLFSSYLWRPSFHTNPFTYTITHSFLSTIHSTYFPHAQTTYIQVKISIHIRILVNTSLSVSIFIM